MKKLVFNSLIFIAFCCLSLSSLKASNPKDTSWTCSTVSRQEYNKVIYKEFSVAQNATCNIINKYGKVNVRGYDGDKTKIKVTIIVQASSQKDADAAFGRIDINFYNDPNFVKAETIIGESKSSWGWNWGINNSNDFSINYEVYVPRPNRVDINNRYGDTYLGAVTNQAKAEIKYGNLQVDDFNQDLDLYLGYGNANIDNTKNLNAELSYGKIIQKTAKNVNLISKYGQFNLDKGDDIKIDSKYDNFTMGDISSINISTKYGNLKMDKVGSATIASAYTNVDIDRVENYVDADLSYGGLKINSVGRNFSEIRVNAKYTDVKLKMDEGTPYRLDATASYADIKYPSNFVAMYDKQQNQTSKVEGYMHDKNAKGLIKVALGYGGLTVK